MPMYWIIGLLMNFSGFISGDNATAVPGVSTMTTDTLSAFIISIKITNRIYNDSLKDHQSFDYKTLREEVEDVISNAYSHTPSAQYRNVTEMTFSNGSVIASSTVLFGTKQLNQQAVKNIFITNYQQDSSTLLDVNINYTANQEPIPVKIPFFENISDSFVSDHPAHITTIITTNAIDSNIASSFEHTSLSTISYATNSDAQTHTSATSARHVTQSDSHTYTSATSAIHLSPHSHTSTDSYNHITVNNSTTISVLNNTTHNSKDTTTSPKSHFTFHINDSTTHSYTSTLSPPMDNTIVLLTNFTSASSHLASTGGRVNHTPLGPEEQDSLAAEESVPGWGIAILVLAAIILFFLMLLILLLLLCWCCWWRHRGFMTVSDPEPIGFYNPDIPMYSTHSMYESHNGKSMDSETEGLPKNRTGIYAMNK